MTKNEFLWTLFNKKAGDIMVRRLRGQKAGYVVCDLIAIGNLLGILGSMMFYNAEDIENIKDYDDLMDVALELYQNASRAFILGFDKEDPESGRTYEEMIMRGFVSVRRYCLNCHENAVDYRKEKILRLYEAYEKKGDFQRGLLEFLD